MNNIINVDFGPEEKIPTVVEFMDEVFRAMIYKDEAISCCIRLLELTAEKYKVKPEDLLRMIIVGKNKLEHEKQQEQEVDNEQ